MPPSPEPVIRTEERVFKNEDGDTVTQTITTSTETVTTLKPVEVVEEVVADVVGPETVTEEGDLDMAWLAKQIADNEKIAGLELPDGLTTQEIVLIAKAIKTNSVLDKLDLQGNEINDTGLLAIAEGLAVNRGIEEFRIGNQTVVASDETERILAEAVFKNSNLLVFTYGFRNIKYQKLVEEALARNNTAHIASRTQKITKTVFVEEVKEITKVLATETEIEDEDDACVSGPTSNKDLANAASTAAAPAVAVAVAAIAAAVPACVDDSSKDVSATPVVVNEIAIGEAPVDGNVPMTGTTSTTTTTDQLIVPATGYVTAETVPQTQEQDYVVVEEKVEEIPVPTAPSSDSDLSYVQVSEDDTPSIDKEMLSLEHMEPCGDLKKPVAAAYVPPPESSSSNQSRAVFGYDQYKFDQFVMPEYIRTTATKKKKHPATSGFLHDNPPVSINSQTPAEKTVAFGQTPSYTAPVDPVADAKNRRKMILLRLEALKSDDYDTYEEFVAAQQALSLELVELEKYEAPSDDTAPAVAEKSSTTPTSGEGISIFGYLGKAAANVGKGLSDTANAVAKAATAPASAEKESTRVSSGFVNYQFYIDNQPVPSVDEIPTTAKIVAYDEKASYPVSDDPIADAITRRKMIVFRLETLKPDDYETYEEYVAAQQALSLELVELEKYQAPSSDAAPAFEEEVSTVPSSGEGIKILGYLGKAAAGVGKGLSDAANAVANAAAAPSSEYADVSAKSSYGQTPVSSTYGQVPAAAESCVDPVEEAKRRRKMILVRIEGLNADDYDTYEEYVAAQQALSLELVELERSQPLGNVDVKALTVEEDVNAEVLVVPGEGDGTNVFGLLGKVAAGVGRGLNAVVEGVESGVSAVGQGVQKAGEALASNSSDTPYLEDAFAVPNALDQISADRVAIPEAQATYSTPATAAYTTTAVGEAPSAKKSPAKKGRFSMTLTKPLGSSSGRPTPSSSPLPSCTTPTPDSVRNTSTSTTTTTTTTSTSASYTPSFTGIPEIREEDYETYEEYLLAQQAASLAIVEQNAYRELSNAEIKEVEEDTIGEENVFLEGLSKRVAGVVKGAVGIVEDGLQDVKDALKDAGNGPVLEEDMFETKTIQELTTAACEGEVVGSVVGQQQQPQSVSAAGAYKSACAVELRPEDFDTFEEYVAAQQAASLEVVEGAAPLKPSKRTVEITRTKEIDVKLANADDSSAVAGGKSWYEVIVEPVVDVAAGAYNAVVRPDVSTPEAKEKTQQGRVNAAAASATVVGILGIVLFKVARSTVE